MPECMKTFVASDYVSDHVGTWFPRKCAGEIIVIIIEELRAKYRVGLNFTLDTFYRRQVDPKFVMSHTNWDPASQQEQQQAIIQIELKHRRSTQSWWIPGLFYRAVMIAITSFPSTDVRSPTNGPDYNSTKVFSILLRIVPSAHTGRVIRNKHQVHSKICISKNYSMSAHRFVRHEL